MIVHVDKTQQKNIRRQLLTDVVYAITHDALKNQNQTTLSPIEIYLSAQEFYRIVNTLSDPDEGLSDEIEDLVEEAANNTEAMFIITIAAIMLKATNTNGAMDSIIVQLFEYCQNDSLFMPLLEQFSQKEEQRYAIGKITNLIDYELKEIEVNKENPTEARKIIATIIDNADKMGTNNITALLVTLNKFNLDNNHIIDSEIQKLYEKLNYSTMKVGEIKELVMNKYVENEVERVEPGATGIVKN